MDPRHRGFIFVLAGIPYRKVITYVQLSLYSSSSMLRLEVIRVRLRPLGPIILSSRQTPSRGISWTSLHEPLHAPSPSVVLASPYLAVRFLKWFTEIGSSTGGI